MLLFPHHGCADLGEDGPGAGVMRERRHDVGVRLSHREIIMAATLRNFLLRLVRDEEGQDLIEYALLATFVALVAIAGASLLGNALNQWYGAVATRVDSAAAAAS